MAVKWGELSARDRDARVAEEVMGWVDVRMGTTGLAGGIEPGADYRLHVPVPPYTTDIAAAWEVVESLQERGWWAKVLFHADYVHGRVPGWTTEFREVATAQEGHALAFALTAPEAIAIAALRACGVEVET